MENNPGNRPHTWGNVFISRVCFHIPAFCMERLAVYPVLLPHCHLLTSWSFHPFTENWYLAQSCPRLPNQKPFSPFCSWQTPNISPFWHCLVTAPLKKNPHSRICFFINFRERGRGGGNVDRLPPICTPIGDWIHN